MINLTPQPIKISPGTLFEYRIARLRFSQGYFVRRSVDVWPSGIEGNKLAEIDCIASSFDPQLRRSVEIIECKTSKGGQGEIDRIAWLKGMASFAGARTSTLAKLQLAPRARAFANDLNVQVLDGAAVASAEKSLNINPDWWPGFHDPIFGETIVKAARSKLSSSVELRRGGKFLFGSFWFSDDFTRVKQLHTFFRLLTDHAATLPVDAVRLGAGEASTLLAFTAISIASWKGRMISEEFRQLVEAQLSSGLSDPKGLRVLLGQIDNFQRDQIEALHHAYQLEGVGRVVFPVRDLVSEILDPPEWIEGFVNLIERLSAKPQLATDVMRWIDLWAASLLGAPVQTRIVETKDQDLQGSLDQLLAFLTRQWHVPKELFIYPTGT